MPRLILALLALLAAHHAPMTTSPTQHPPQGSHGGWRPPPCPPDYPRTVCLVGRYQATPV
jgi:hypothetical protein